MPKDKTKRFTICCNYPVKEGGPELFVPVKGHTFRNYNLSLAERGYVIVGNVTSDNTGDYEADSAKAVELAKTEFDRLFKIAQLLKQVIAGEIACHSAYRYYDDSVAGIVSYNLVLCKIVEDEATKYLIVDGGVATEKMAVISQLTDVAFFPIRGNWTTVGIMLPDNKVIPFGQPL